MNDSLINYPWILGLSAFIGVLWTWIQAGDDHPGRSIKSTESFQTKALHAASLALIGAFIGSRLMYIGLHLQGYLINPDSITKYWSSGLDWGGAPLGAFLFLIPLLIRNRNQVYEILDSLTPLWTCICFGAWFAVSSVPVYYSNSVPPALWSVNLPDLFGIVVPRFPIGFIGVIWTVFADISARRQQKLSIPMIRLISITINQMILCFILSFIRSDYVPVIGQIPADRLASLIYIWDALSFFYCCGVLPA